MNQQFESRVSSLEKKLRIYQFLTLIIFSIGLSLALVSFSDDGATQETLTVRGLKVVDDQGRTVIELKQDKGMPQINTLTSAGKKSTSITASTAGVGNIFTYDTDGDLLFKVTSTQGGGGYMALYNSKLSPVMEAGITVNEAGYIYLNDRSKKTFFNCTQSSTGGGVLSLLNDGIEAVNLSSPNAGGRIGVYNSSKVRVGYLGTEESKDGVLYVWKSDGTKAANLP